MLMAVSSSVVLAGWRSRVKSALCPVVISSSRVVALDTGLCNDF